jgi:nucleoside-diphosphate-sugar epimerase
MRVAVTGAAGAVGSALVKSLADSGAFDVVALVRNGLGACTLGSINAEIRVGSIADPESSRQMFAGCDAVINCALPKGWPRSTRQVTDAILRNIANAPDVRAAVHFSSVAVYGACVDPSRNSFERPRPTGSYGAEKLRSEGIAARLFSERGLRYYILRLGHVYGPAQQVSYEIAAKTADPSFALPFGGHMPSNAVSIHAVIHAIRGMLEDTQPTGIRNLIDTPQSTWREIYDYHTAMIGRPPAPSIPDADSRATQSRLFGEARAPIRTIMRTAKSVARSTDLLRIAQTPAFRHVINGPMAWAPASLEPKARHAYVLRKVAAAVRQMASRETPPPRMHAPAVPGPTFNVPDKHEAAAAMHDALKAWMSSMSTYRWAWDDEPTTAASHQANRSAERDAYSRADRGAAVP